MESESIKPKALKKGGTIALISPSARLNHVFPNRITRTIEYLESQGYKVKEIFKDPLPSDYEAGLKARCDEIHEAFRDKSVDAAICTIGGITCNEILEHIDYELIKANPKIFCGYSDITLLHHAIYVKCNLRTFYGPAAIPQFGEYPSPMPFVTEHFFKTVTETSIPSGSFPLSKQWTQEFLDWGKPEEDTKPKTFEPALPWTWLRKGHAAGRLFGGCLPSLCQLTGTPFLPANMYAGRILFIELPEADDGPDKPFLPEMARCCMTDLRIKGILKVVVGLVVGRPYVYDEEMRKEFERMVVEQCYGTTFPILANVDVGHTNPILTLPLDAYCSMDSTKDEFRSQEAAVV